MPTFALCRLPQAIDHELTYAVPDSLRETARPGMRAVVPLRKGRAVALITAVDVPEPKGMEIREIIQVLDSRPLYDSRHLEFLKWVGEYYMAPQGLVLRAALPPPMRRLPGQRAREKARPAVPPPAELLASGPSPENLKLTEHQERAVAAAGEAIRACRHEAFLLHGVTGSGKTEVYIRCAALATERGRGTIVLVPEIALSYQVVARFRARFGDRVVVLHSRMTGLERSRALERAAHEPAILIGARSAVLAPMASLGLMVVDEEQEGAYKQEESPPLYNARECALIRARHASCPILLGSATPSLESAHRARTGLLKTLEMPERIDRTPLPEVEIVSMAGQPPQMPLSPRLMEALCKAVSGGNQALLFLNRRGFAPALICAICGATVKCPRCTTNLVFHSRENEMRCHWCGKTMARPRSCERCRAEILRPLGIGTQRIEAEIRKLMPHARVVRMDLDTTRARQSHRKLLEEFSAGDILIGTQMIAKGLDFPRLSLVGVVLADLSLNLPDFRAGERTFQLITQVAGRAGRRDKRGKVIIQTFAPDHPVIGAAAAQEFWRFYESETPLRKAFSYPPFGRLIRLRITGKRRMDVSSIARSAAQIASRNLDPLASVLGPAPAMPEVVHRNVRWHVLIKGPSGKGLWRTARRTMDELSRVKGINQTKVSVDVDPLNVVS